MTRAVVLDYQQILAIINADPNPPAALQAFVEQEIEADTHDLQREVDDAVCDLMMAVRHGKYDGLDRDDHFRRVRKMLGQS